MKKIFILTFFIFKVPVFSQSGQIEYVSFLKSDITNYFNKELENIVDKDDSNIFYSLIVNGNKSIFFCENTLSKKTNKINLQEINSKLIGTVFLDLKNKVFVQKKIVYGEELTIKDTIKNYAWELISNETKIIDNMLCYKAIHKEMIEKKIENEKNEIQVIKKEKIITAWYCPSININVGPLGFYGLPGLIIILEDDIFVYQAKKINLKLNYKQKKLVEPPKASKYLNNDEFKLEYNRLKLARENMMKN